LSTEAHAIASWGRWARFQWRGSAARVAGDVERSLEQRPVGVVGIDLGAVSSCAGPKVARFTRSLDGLEGEQLPRCLVFVLGFTAGPGAGLVAQVDAEVNWSRVGKPERGGALNVPGSPTDGVGVENEKTKREINTDGAKACPCVPSNRRQSQGPKVDKRRPERNNGTGTNEGGMEGGGMKGSGRNGRNG
jgi:hypothetical protein